MTTSTSPTHTRRRRAVLAALVAALVVGLLPASASAQVDGRAGLLPGQEASTPNLERLSNSPKPAGLDDFNSDLAFRGDLAFAGNFEGVAVYDISDPAAPTLRTTIRCPGSQNDVSIDGDLLYVSVESGGFTTCDDGSADGAVPFRGVRIFDVSDLDEPRQVAAVQTCRGSHTHTLVPGPSGTTYVYVSGVISPRTDTGGAGLGCSDAGPQDPDESRWRIDIIEVPDARPDRARLVAGPRIFAEGDRIDGLQQSPPSPLHPSLTPWLPSPVTQSCHDLTAYPQLGLAAGACEGNGILLDISDPLRPRRVAAVADPNFAYWHSATFNDDGTKVVFTDEWGGGLLPYCQPIHRAEWGANGIYDIVRSANGTLSLELASYYKIPNTQSAAENCVAHNGSLIPVPGRDVMVQAWYQGGISVFDFTDSAAPFEIAWFDRGPAPVLPVLDGAGFWSAYWYDGHIYGTEIARGFDSFRLTGSDALSQAAIDQAAAVRYGQLNVQSQERYGTGRPPGATPARSVCADVRGTSFRDVPAGPPHGDNVRCVAAYGIARGSADGTYRPASDVRRDQMASFLERLLVVAGADLPDDPPDAFSDDDGSVHERAIDRLAAIGVVQGRDDGTFRPAVPVTRAQMASFLVRALEHALERDLDAPPSRFADTAGSVHARAIDVAAHLGIALGRTPTRFAPGEDVRRDQMASFLARTLDHLATEGVALTSVG
ncbi:hypothetical protein FTX61_06755 [Nitriliruptoraceae bacterium ZYF776]|nr:hypothetical protein [Profundirhabdus halotolerans]